MNKENPYFSLFHDTDNKVPLSSIERSCSPFLVKAVETMLKCGKVVGQRFWNEEGKEDVLLWMPDRNGKREDH